MIDQELRFFARLHRSARSELRIQLQRTLIGSKTLRKRGQVRQRHLPKTIAGAHAGARFDLCEGVLIHLQRDGVPAAHVMDVADVVQAGDLAVSIAARAIDNKTAAAENAVTHVGSGPWALRV